MVDSSLKAPVGYYQCAIQRTQPLSKRCTFKGCKIKETLQNAYVLSINSDVYDCEFHLYGDVKGIASYSAGTFTFDLVGNVFSFEDGAHTGTYMLNCTSSTGCICNNVVTGANTASFWRNDVELGTSANNIVKEAT